MGFVGGVALFISSVANGQVSGNCNSVINGNFNTVSLYCNDPEFVARLITKEVVPRLNNQLRAEIAQELAPIREELKHLEEQRSTGSAEGVDSVAKLDASIKRILANQVVESTAEDTLQKAHEIEGRIDENKDPATRSEARDALKQADFERASSLLTPWLTAVGAPVAIIGAGAMYSGMVVLIVAALDHGHSHSLVTPAWIATLGGGALAFGVGGPVVVSVSERPAHSCKSCDDAGAVLVIAGLATMVSGVVPLAISLVNGGEAVVDKAVLFDKCDGNICTRDQSDRIGALHEHAHNFDKWMLRTGAFELFGAAFVGSGLSLNTKGLDNLGSHDGANPFKSVSLSIGFGTVGIQGRF